MSVTESKTIVAKEDERSTLQRIAEILKSTGKVPGLVGSEGEEIELPPSVLQVLRQSVYYMLRGRGVNIVSIDEELSTQEAADMLNVSRPFLVKLLEEGNIPFTKVGTHRRVKLQELLAYKKQRSIERKRALAEIARISQEEGLYD